MAVPPPRPRAGMRDPGPSSPNSRELPPGSVVLGRYTIQKVLGRGGMATVYLARHQQTERLVALKLLDPEISRDPNYVERFRREARAAGRIRSDYVVAIYDLDAEVGGSLVLVMEYLEGQTVQQSMKSGRMPIERVLSFGRHLLEGLAAAHAAGVVHRDLKPANLFVERSSTGSEKCKILDFGISKLADTSQQELTRDGQTLGTVAYMAPEQIRGKASSTDPRIDLYAAGVTLFIMFTGKRPIDADDTVQLLAAVLENPPLTLAQAAGMPFPAALENFFVKALQKDPNVRFQTALEMREGLLEAARSIGHEATGILQVPSTPAAGGPPAMSSVEPSPSSGVRSRTALGVGGPTPPRPTLMGVGNQSGPPPVMRTPPPPPGRSMPPQVATPFPGPPAMPPPAMMPPRPHEMSGPPPMPMASPASANGNGLSVGPMGPSAGPPLNSMALGSPFGPVPALPPAPPPGQAPTVPLQAAPPRPSAAGSNTATRIALALAGIGTAALVTTAVVLTLSGRTPARPPAPPVAAVTAPTAHLASPPAPTAHVVSAPAPTAPVAPPAVAVAPTATAHVAPVGAPLPDPVVPAHVAPVVAPVALQAPVAPAPPPTAPPVVHRLAVTIPPAESHPTAVAAARTGAPPASEPVVHADTHPHDRAAASTHDEVGAHSDGSSAPATTAAAPHHHAPGRRPGIVEAAPF